MTNTSGHLFTTSLSMHFSGLGAIIETLGSFVRWINNPAVVHLRLSELTIGHQPINFHGVGSGPPRFGSVWMQGSGLG
jgi:hypothetical protein